MKCFNCRKVVDDGVKHCPYCGINLTGEFKNMSDIIDVIDEKKTYRGPKVGEEKVRKTVREVIKPRDVNYTNKNIEVAEAKKDIYPFRIFISFLAVLLLGFLLFLFYKEVVKNPLRTYYSAYNCANNKANARFKLEWKKVIFEKDKDKISFKYDLEEKDDKFIFTDKSNKDKKVLDKFIFEKTDKEDYKLSIINDLNEDIYLCKKIKK